MKRILLKDNLSQEELDRIIREERQQERERISELFIKFENDMDIVISEYTNGFGDITYNKLIDKFKKDVEKK